MTDAVTKSDRGLLPAWALLSGWLFFTGQTIFISRIVYESTVLTCFNGPQMVGFAMFHGIHNFFLLGLAFLPFGGLFAIVMLVFGAVKKFQLRPREWMLLAALLVSFPMLFVPYRVWERFDMTFCSSGPLGDAVLLDAARSGNLELVKKLVGQGHNVNRNSGSGDRPLSSAAMGGDVRVVAFLLSSGANVNARNNLLDETALMRAAHSGNVQVLKLLLDRGADPCTINQRNESAQSIAEKNHNQEFASYLAINYHCPPPPHLPTSCTNESAATCVEVH